MPEFPSGVAEDSRKTNISIKCYSDLKEKHCSKMIEYHDENDDPKFKVSWLQRFHRNNPRLHAAIVYLLLAIAIGGMCYNYHATKRDDLQMYMDDNPLESDMWQTLSARPLIILVTGKTGTGKSALINGLIGKNVSKEGETLRPETTEVAYHQRIVNGVPMRVFDSPGLQDGTEKETAYMQDMSEKCKEVDLILYTIKMTDERMHDDDVRAMRKLTVAFGEKFWSKAMIVLTFANDVRVPAEPGLLNYEKNDEKFQRKLQLWSDILPSVLSNKLGISSDVVIKLPIVPAGYYKVQHLPGRRYWFSEFWKTALNRMKENNEDRARFMLEYSKDRWKMVYESTSDDFKWNTDKQYIYDRKERKGWGWWG